MSLQLCFLHLPWFSTSSCVVLIILTSHVITAMTTSSTPPSSSWQQIGSQQHLLFHPKWDPPNKALKGFVRPKIPGYTAAATHYTQTNTQTLNTFIGWCSWLAPHRWPSLIDPPWELQIALSQTHTHTYIHTYRVSTPWYFKLRSAGRHPWLFNPLHFLSCPIYFSC